MSELEPLLIDFKDLAALLVKEKGIHEGLWGVFVRFAITAANVNMKSAEGETTSILLPAALVPVTEIGIQRFPEANNLTVDAAVVNPKKKKPAKTTSNT